jgi:hypothetical protein
MDATPGPERRYFKERPMGLKDLMTSVSGDAKSALNLAGDKAMQLLADYKAAAQQIEPLGFKVGKMTIGMGLLPEVHTSLVGEVDSVDIGRLTTMMEEKKDDKLLVSMLKALVIAKTVHSHVESKLTAVTLQISLSVPPSVMVELS